MNNLQIEKEKLLAGLQFNLESLIELIESIKNDDTENMITNIEFTGFTEDKKNRLYDYISELKHSPRKEDQPLKENQIINNDYLVEANIDLINELRESKQQINWNNFKHNQKFYDNICNEYTIEEVYHATKYIRLV